MRAMAGLICRRSDQSYLLFKVQIPDSSVLVRLQVCLGHVTGEILALDRLQVHLLVGDESSQRGLRSQTPPPSQEASGLTKSPRWRH